MLLQLSIQEESLYSTDTVAEKAVKIQYQEEKGRKKIRKIVKKKVIATIFFKMLLNFKCLIEVKVIRFHNHPEVP